MRRSWALLVSVRVPATPTERVMVGWSGDGGGLPQERGQFTGTRDRDNPGRFATGDVQPLPLAVQPLLRAPRDGAHARVGADLPTLQGHAQAWGRRR